MRAFQLIWYQGWLGFSSIFQHFAAFSRNLYDAFLTKSSTYCCSISNLLHERSPISSWITQLAPLYDAMTGPQYVKVIFFTFRSCLNTWGVALYWESESSTANQAPFYNRTCYRWFHPKIPKPKIPQPKIPQPKIPKAKIPKIETTLPNK